MKLVNSLLESVLSALVMPVLYNTGGKVHREVVVYGLGEEGCEGFVFVKKTSLFWSDRRTQVVHGRGGKETVVYLISFAICGIDLRGTAVHGVLDVGCDYKSPSSGVRDYEPVVGAGVWAVYFPFIARV